MTKTRRNQLRKVYAHHTEEALRASHALALKLGTEKAKDHAEIIEEMLEGAL